MEEIHGGRDGERLSIVRRWDAYDYIASIMKISGLVSGVVPYALLTIGFNYYLSKLPRQDQTTS